ncbi:AAA family ATPase [Jiella sonneratiae]|uniref:Adenylate kinase n=1 Tax=Jiella sonneratiae TaxID=2816856 RepID=A0ABS3J3U4_9HYPH|nr:AAA family ATPase [Jiella sonneratiae]MBO0904337.1 AAA family ATPase [Jiella sonneratiae]
MLVVLSGLPGAGKSTIARILAARRSATYVRVDEIETVLRRETFLGSDVGAAGYVVAFAIARSNLACGNLVVADSVNPVPESRRGWRNAAEASGAPFLEVELVCSDEDEHRRRIETRSADVAGLELPTWEMVKTRDYAPWATARLVIDTAGRRPDDAVAEIEKRIDAVWTEFDA